ncbi:MAG: efflux RND transporter periplasmic adaptor subunit [Ahrensia sp.]
MKIWKQLLICVALAAVIGAGFVMWHPAAPEMLARFGLDRFVPSSLAQETTERPGQGGQSGQQRRGGREALVVVSKVVEQNTNGRISAIGSGQASRTVSVRPTVAGQISAMNVVSGGRVAAGDVLITLNEQTEKLALERAQLSLQTAQERFDRVNSLFDRGSISSVEVELARDTLDLAELELRDAELALSRRTITAPISGTLGILSVGVGDYVSSQNEVATIDDRSQIVVDFFVPERAASLMQVGLPVTVMPTAMPGETFEGNILVTDNRIDEASRTLRVRASIPNPDSTLRAGMSFEIVIDVPGETYPAIDPLALQWDSAGSYVWRIADNKAERVPAVIIQRNSNAVLVKSEINAGDLIVVEGIQSVRNGAAVNVANTDELGSENADVPSSDAGA